MRRTIRTAGRGQPLIEPESATREPAISMSNLTINSTYFSGIMIHFPANDCLRISAKPMAEGN